MKEQRFEYIDEKITDINISIYEAARAELVQRIVLRDGALLFYIASIGAYLNSLVSFHYAKPTEEIDLAYALICLMPLPIVCLIFTLIIIQHHIVIGRLGAFLRSELHWSKLHAKISPHWDNSRALLGQANFLILLRLYAQGLVLSLPLFYNIIFYFRFRSRALALDWYWHSFMLALLFCDFASVALIAYLHIYGHLARKREW